MTPWHPLPPRIFRYVEQTPGTVLLHSSRRGGSSFSRLFTAPVQILEVRRLEELPDIFSAVEDAVERGRFAAGYFAYECAQYFEPAASVRHLHEPDLLAYFGIYEHCHKFDHSLGTFDSDPPVPASLDRDSDLQESSLLPTLTFDLDEQQFTSHIERIQDWIRDGDVYQLNFTFPLQARFTESPAHLYARLTAAQPVDYGAFLHTKPGRHILSLAPELFFRINEERRITCEPMKGTAPRGRTTSEDSAIAKWLVHDAKNCAENVMIVDLIRNDLGRICSFGSVKVKQLFEVERYPSLWQMTSKISGDLRPTVGYDEIFRALFPCGSITGAPKVHAMQLLAQIEEQARGVYTGAIGFFSNDETVFNVAIRTLELENGAARGGVGSGIVIDSEPADEFRECQLKAEFLTRSVKPFSLIETMLWKGSFPLLELHLDRLSDSSYYFDFACSRDAVREVLLAAAAQISDNLPRKFRLLLHANGETHLTSAVLTNSSSDEEPLRACIASHRTHPDNPFLFHKTTGRGFYNSAHAAALSSGFADILFFNIRDEVTEGAVSNIFIENSGLWYTPPLDCGVLPGVYRRYLLSTRPEIQEKTLTMNDLKAADSVYICNAVRGLRRVTIDFEGHVKF